MAWIYLENISRFDGPSAKTRPTNHFGPTNYD